MATLNWTKAPSVWTGGKPYFWTALDRHNVRWWVVWDRAYHCWQVSNNNSTDTTSFNHPAQAKRFAEQMQEYPCNKPLCGCA